MQRYIHRICERELEESLAANPVTAVLGPRQAGKSTLVRHVLSGRDDVLILDLDLPSDMRRLTEPELFLREHSARLICIDEIQLKPDLFPLVRALIDEDRRPGRFLILGSASQDLIRQTSESLAGRIHYIELTPFLYSEISGVLGELNCDFRRHWDRGGFPPAFLDDNERHSYQWRYDLVQTFLARDIPQFGFAIPAPTMLRFWRMLAHYHGSVLNASKLGQALDISHNTVRRYLDILEQTFMVRVLRPLELNVKKRLVKSPKVYLRDSGLLHVLLEIENMDALFANPIFGASWEGWCAEQITAVLPEWRPGFYRTSSGEEIDLVLERGQRRLAFEFKASLSPKLSKGLPGSLDVLQPERTWVVCPMTREGYPFRDGLRIAGLSQCLAEIREFA